MPSCRARAQPNFDYGYRQVRPLPLVFVLQTVSGAQVAACLRSLKVNTGEKRVHAGSRLYPEAVYTSAATTYRVGASAPAAPSVTSMTQHLLQNTALQVLLPRLEHGL